MPDLEWNRQVWQELYHWEGAGEEWSESWGGSQAQWFGAIFPRIHLWLPAGSILEIGCGYGRWTQYLLEFCDHYWGVDLAPKCVEFCQKRFEGVSKATFLVNDGLSLDTIPKGEIDFVFSFDSLVHAELDVLQRYVVQILERLSNTGTAFIHHSNYLGSTDTVNFHHRGETVSAVRVRECIEGCGDRFLSRR